MRYKSVPGEDDSFDFSLGHCILERDAEYVLILVAFHITSPYNI